MPSAFLTPSKACQRVTPCACAAAVSAAKRESPPSISMIAARSVNASTSSMLHHPADAIALVGPRHAILAGAGFPDLRGS